MEYPQPTDGPPILLLNPGHGNEPYILATAIGREVSKKFRAAGMQQPILVMPLLYGDRQIRILLEENPNDAALLHIDEEYGRILQNIMFGAGNFREHLAQVNAHYEAVEQMLNRRYNRGNQSVTVTSVATGESVPLSPKNIIGTIETGNRVAVKIPHRYFAFPELLSRILHESMEHPELGFDDSHMRELAQRMLHIEADYAQVFVPWVSTLSYQHATDLDHQPETVEGRSRVYTPPMKVPIAQTSGEVREGIYIMFSGTGSATNITRGLVDTAKKAGIAAYTPPWIDVEGTEKQPPSVMTDEHILAVLGRAGWGTLWQTMQLEKPLLVTPYENGDDPEIYFNNKTVEALRLGKIVGTAGIDEQELRELAEHVSPGLSAVNHAIHKKFGTNDGIDYIAEAIFQDLCGAQERI